MMPKLTTLQQELRDPSLTALLALQVLVIFVVGPIASVGIEIPTELTATIVLGLIVLVVIVSRSLGPMIVVVGAVVVSGIGALLRLAAPSALTDWLGACGAVLALSSVSWVVTGVVFGPGGVTAHRIRGAVVLYLNIALLFTSLYRLIAELVPGAFAGMPAVMEGPRSVDALTYFSLSTLTTIGYGDITPVHPFARSLSNLEAIIGQLYPTLILARIVTLYSGRTDGSR